MKRRLFARSRVILYHDSEDFYHFFFFYKSVFTLYAVFYQPGESAEGKSNDVDSDDH